MDAAILTAEDERCLAPLMHVRPGDEEYRAMVAGAGEAAQRTAGDSRMQRAAEFLPKPIHFNTLMTVLAGVRAGTGNSNE